MSIDNTIPGGAYQSPDGSWHDANGKPIKPPKIAPQAPQEPQEPQESGETVEDTIPPVPSLSEYEKPSEMVSEDDKPKAKRKSTKKA